MRLIRAKCLAAPLAPVASTGARLDHCTTVAPCGKFLSFEALTGPGAHMAKRRPALPRSAATKPKRQGARGDLKKTKADLKSKVIGRRGQLTATPQVLHHHQCLICRPRACIWSCAG